MKNTMMPKKEKKITKLITGRVTARSIYENNRARKLAM